MEQDADERPDWKPDPLLDQETTYLHNCPYLGLVEDRLTSIGFPAPANNCHRLKSPASIDLAHQRTYCLSGEHEQCYVFQQKVPDVAPAQERARMPVPPVKDLGAGLLGFVDQVSAALRWPFIYFREHVTLPPDPWGRESFAVPPNPFAEEFAKVPVLLRKGFFFTSAFTAEQAAAFKVRLAALRQDGPQWVDERGVDLRALTAAAVAFVQRNARATNAAMRERILLPDVPQRLVERIKIPQTLTDQPAAYFAFPAMILLMLLAAFVWWPLPGQAVEMATVRGETVAELSSTAEATTPAAVTLSDSWARAPILPVQAATAPAVDGSLAAAVDQAPALAPVFINPTKLGGAADNIAGDDPFMLQLPEATSLAAIATTAPFVLGPPQPLPSATPPASEPAQAAAAPPLPTAIPTTVPAAPTASPTVAPSPTLVPTLEPTPVPTVAVAGFAAQPRSGTAYIHTGALNIRSGPGLGYSSLDVAYNREPVQLLAGREDDPWVLIRLGSGTEGWVNINYLVFEPQP